MTAKLFEEWLKKFDLRMKREKQKICLLVNNFPGHCAVAYEPSNVRVKFFTPNMTPYVQPCDAGIIKCHKALYCNLVCLRAVDRDEAGEADIFKLNILEAMLMMKEAWEDVSSTTIQNCLKHTKILPAASNSLDSSMPSESSTVPDAQPPTESTSLITQGWGILREFATQDLQLPQIEEQLERLFGQAYDDAMWWPALSAVLAVECDTDLALENVERLAKESQSATAVIQSQPKHTTALPPPQLSTQDLQLSLTETSITVASCIDATESLGTFLMFTTLSTFQRSMKLVNHLTSLRLMKRSLLKQSITWMWRAEDCWGGRGWAQWWWRGIRAK